MFDLGAGERAGWSNLPAGDVGRAGISVGELSTSSASCSSISWRPRSARTGIGGSWKSGAGADRPSGGAVNSIAALTPGN